MYNDVVLHMTINSYSYDVQLLNLHLSSPLTLSTINLVPIHSFLRALFVAHITHCTIVSSAMTSILKYLVIIATLLVSNADSDIEVTQQPTPSGQGCEITLCPEGTECRVNSIGPQCVSRSCTCGNISKPVCCRRSSGAFVSTSNKCRCNGCDKRDIVVPSSFCNTCDSLDCGAGRRCVNSANGAICRTICVCPIVAKRVCCLTPSGVYTKASSCECDCILGAKVILDGKCPAILDKCNSDH